MIGIIFLLLVSGIGFVTAWNLQRVEIEYLKQELQLEKARSHFYKNRGK